MKSIIYFDKGNYGFKIEKLGLIKVGFQDSINNFYRNNRLNFNGLNSINQHNFLMHRIKDEVYFNYNF